MDGMLSELNDEQLDCVTHEADVLQILAGPGSGKVARVIQSQKTRLMNSRLECSQYG